jgi:hypothetical protein
VLVQILTVCVDIACELESDVTDHVDAMPRKKQCSMNEWLSDS